MEPVEQMVGVIEQGGPDYFSDFTAGDDGGDYQYVPHDHDRAHARNRHNAGVRYAEGGAGAQHFSLGGYFLGPAGKCWGGIMLSGLLALILGNITFRVDPSLQFS